MLDEKTIKEAEQRIKQHITDGTIISKQPVEQKRLGFFLESADDAIESAQTLLDIATNEDYQRYTGHEGSG